MPRCACRLLVPLTLVTTAPLSGQTTVAVHDARVDTVIARAGDAVRFRTADLGGRPRVLGTVRWAHRDSLGVQVFPYTETYVFDRPVLAALEVRRHAPGWNRRAGRAALVGALVGGVVGYVLGDQLRCRPAGAPPGYLDFSCDTGPGDVRGPFVVLGAVAGSGAGWLTWAALERPRWVPAELPRR